MNLRLDQFLHRLTREPGLLAEAVADPAGVAVRYGIAFADVELVLRGDLAGLRRRDAHPLLLMRLAEVLRIDAMEQLTGRQPVT